MLHKMHMWSMCMGALALVQHAHGCNTYMVAACAWWHMHECSMCMVTAFALVQQMHVCGIVMLVPCWPPPRRGSFATLAAPPCITHMCMLQHLHAPTRVLLARQAWAKALLFFF